MDNLDLMQIYQQLKNRYNLELTNAFSLNAGFRKDFQVLFGQSSQNKFYLYHDGAIAIFDIENLQGTFADHWHPDNTQQAIQMVIDFMEDTCEFDWLPIEQE